MWDITPEEFEVMGPWGRDVVIDFGNDTVFVTNEKSLIEQGFSVEDINYILKNKLVAQ